MYGPSYPIWWNAVMPPTIPAQSYSPNVVEGGFSEVELPFYGVLRSSYSPGPTPIGVAPSDRGYMQPLRVRALEARATSFSSYPLPERASREMSSLCQGDRSNDDPQH